MKYHIKYPNNDKEYTQQYNTIIQQGLFEINDPSGDKTIVVDQVVYHLTKIFFECTPNVLNSREILVSAIYLEHQNLANTTKYVYVKIPVVKDDNKNTTYKKIRTFMNKINDGDMDSNPKIHVQIGGSTLHAAIPTKDNAEQLHVTTIYTFSKGDNAGYILELKPMNVKTNLKFSVNSDKYTEKSFYIPNITDNNSIMKIAELSSTSTTKEGFGTFYSDIEPMTCKRKSNTGVINNTFVGGEMGKLLINANQNVTIATVVMFFISLSIITIAYLSAKTHGFTEVVANVDVLAPNGGAAASMVGGGLCELDSNNLTNGYILIILLAGTILNFYGALYLTEMFMLIVGVICMILLILFYYFGTKTRLSFANIEIEQLILYSRQKPFVKWFAISAYYVWITLFLSIITKKGLSSFTFISVQTIFWIFALLAYVLFKNYTNISKMFFQNINQVNNIDDIATAASSVGASAGLGFLFNSVFQFPIVIPIITSAVTQLVFQFEPSSSTDSEKTTTDKKAKQDPKKN